jgi:hypothetical protein
MTGYMHESEVWEHCVMKKIKVEKTMRSPCKNLFSAFVSCVLFPCVFMTSAAGAEEKASLAGEWRFQLDRNRAGIDQRWFEADLNDKIMLPGTTDLAKKGDPGVARDPDRLSRRFPYVDAAWYQRTIDIPEKWNGKRITLTLDRSKPSRAWLDGRELGARDSLVAPHVYELGLAVKPGKHRLSIQVDNGKLRPIGDPHQVSDNTQTNWNGIIGRIELAATDPVWLETITTFPDVEKKSIRVRAKIGNLTGFPAEGKLTINALSRNCPRVHRPSPVTVTFTKLEAGQDVEATLELGADALAWDEFSPALYQLEIVLQGKAGVTPFLDKQTLDAGLRSFIAKGTQFQVNGRNTFLRGKHDACVFPLTGFPPMDKEGWLKVMRVAQSYGINHYRFHTWCPPDAAFAAADELGIYMQPELPNWLPFGDNAEHDRYMLEEGRRLLSAFGNHPSFVMMSLGNEMSGSRPAMAATVAALRAHDPRHLFAQGSNNFFASPSQAEGDDYWTTMRTRSGDSMVRGSFSHADLPLGRIQTAPANTMDDFSKAIAGVTIPVIGHETGQYSVFPDLKEIPKYTGVLEARNFEIVRDRLQSRGMLDHADDFTRASGRLAALCYRADNELAFRTRGFGGFQILDLQDFPGQGTAMVGILNAFMGSKGLITPEEWRQSCSSSVLLLRFPGYTWTNDQTFTATAEIAHYGKEPIAKAAATWALRDEAGKLVLSGTLSSADVPQGSLTTLGAVSFPLDKVKAPARLNLEIKLGAVKNQYPLWVYPARSAQTADGVIIANKFDEKTRSALAQGARVILMPDEALPGTLPSIFTPDFWCWSMFSKYANPPGTMGLLMDPKHPALAEFPTDFYSNWQWFDIANASRPVILDELPAGTRPIVQVIDNFTRCHRLGLVSEFTFGKGRLLLVSVDLNALTDKPAPRQLLASLISYAKSDRFKPTQPLPASLRDALSQINVAKGKNATASSSQADAAYSPEKAVDGNPDSRWCAADGQTGYSWQVDLLKPYDLCECEITWEMAPRTYGYRLEGSSDGTNWTALSDQTQSKNHFGADSIPLDKKGVRHVRITVTGLDPGSWASIREVKVFSKQ